MTVSFYMRGGHVVKACNVDKVTMTRNKETGGFSGYELDFAKAPVFFSVSIPDIVAVTAK